MENNLFFTTKEHGELFIDEIFIFIDEPCIFSLQNKLNHRFIAILEEDSDKKNYIVVPVSLSRYRDFVTNKVAIRDVFINSEQGGSFCVTVTLEGNNIRYINKEEINLLNLPAKNEFIDVKESYTSSELILDAVSENREVFEICFEKNDGHQQSIKAKELSSFLANLQKVYRGIAIDKINKLDSQRDKAKIESYKKNSSLIVTKTFAASFGVRIEGEEFPNFFGETIFSELMIQYFLLTSSKLEEEYAFFLDNKEALTSLRDFYKSLIINKFGVKMKGATPSKILMSSNISKDDACKYYARLIKVIDNNNEQYDLNGHFESVDMKTRTFKFSVENAQQIDGKLDYEFEQTIFDFKKIVTIKVEKTIEVIQAGIKTEKYTLLTVDE